MPTIRTPDGGYISYVDKITDRQLRQYLYNLERKNNALIERRDISREKKLKEIFSKATDRLESNLDRYYKNYATKEGITLAEARKRASEFDIRRWERAAARAVKAKDFTPETNDWLRLYNLKMRASREEVMLAEAHMDMITMFDEVQRLGHAGMTEEALKETQRQAGILSGQPIVKEEIIRLVDSDFYSTNGFSNLIWGRTGHMSKLSKELTDIMTNMHVDQDGYRNNWKALSKRMNVAESNAKRLIITEERRMIAKTQLETYTRNDFEYYVYVAESGACPDCNALDGLVFRTDEAVSGVNFQIMHPFCRCNSHGYKPMERLNTKTGKWEAVSPHDL